jgi:hypothetical protein
MNAFWKSVAEKVLVAVVVAGILAIPFKQAIIYLVDRLGPQAQVPAGTIVAWNGKSTLPDGWAICNGLEGTPDLKDRFLRGTRDVAEVTKTGGAESHVHEVLRVPNSRAAEGIGSDGVRIQGRAEAQNHLPPYFTVIFIIKK